MTYQDRITTDPNVLRGKAIIKEPRISVEMLLSKLSQGASHADLLRSYPRLRQEDIYAALAYASARIANEEELSVFTRV